jgi:hypothetical protein
MTCEEDVFNAVMQWISYDLQQRKQYLFKVNEHFFSSSSSKDHVYIFRY